MTTFRPDVRYLAAAAVLLTLAAGAIAGRPLPLPEIDASIVLPPGWSTADGKPAEGLPGSFSYMTDNGQNGARSAKAAIIVGPSGPAATPEARPKIVDKLLDANVNVWRRLKSLGEAREVQRASTELQGITAGFVIVEIACPPLFDGPPHIVHAVTFAALDDRRSFVCNLTAGDEVWSSAWPAFQRMVNSLCVNRE